MEGKIKKTYKTGKGVLYIKQFPKNFLRPYGQVEHAPDEDTVFRRISPESCEWLKRPKVALSELSDTLSTNLKLLESNTDMSLLSTRGITNFSHKLSPLLQRLENFNTKAKHQATPSDVKGFLKHIIGTDDDVESLIDEAFEVGGALFSIATNLIVARTLCRNAERYGEAIQASDGTDKNFKKERDLKALRRMLEKSCLTKTSQISQGKTSTSRKKMLEVFSSSNSDHPTTSYRRKRKTKHNKDTSHSLSSSSVSSSKFRRPILKSKHRTYSSKIVSSDFSSNTDSASYSKRTSKTSSKTMKGRKSKSFVLRTDSDEEFLRYQEKIRKRSRKETNSENETSVFESPVEKKYRRNQKRGPKKSNEENPCDEKEKVGDDSAIIISEGKNKKNKKKRKS